MTPLKACHRPRLPALSRRVNQSVIPEASAEPCCAERKKYDLTCDCEKSLLCKNIHSHLLESSQRRRAMPAHELRVGSENEQKDRPYSNPQRLHTTLAAAEGNNGDEADRLYLDLYLVSKSSVIYAHETWFETPKLGRFTHGIS